MIDERVAPYLIISHYYSNALHERSSADHARESSRQRMYSRVLPDNLKKYRSKLTFLKRGTARILVVVGRLSILLITSRHAKQYCKK
jgi:hypothetical protein